MYLILLIVRLWDGKIVKVIIIIMESINKIIILNTKDDILWEKGGVII